jgi:hypothetical protein
MLTPLDDSPWHQCADTFDHVATSDPRFFDRFWFAATDPAGAGTLQFTLGVYQNMNVIDGGFVVIHDGRQHNLRVSRELRPRYETRSGSLHLDVLEPMQTLTFGVAPNDSGVTSELTWTATTPAQEERPHYSRTRGRVVEDYTRYDQIGRLSGAVDLNGTHLEVKDWWSCRDHSWGVRPGIGIPEPDTGPAAARRGFTFAFLFFSTDTCAGHAQVLHHTGAPTMTAELRDLTTGTARIGTSLDLRATFIDDQRPRRVRAAALSVATGPGQETAIELEAIGPAVAMAGLGYNGYDDQRGLGVYRGPDHLEHDIWDVTHPALVGLPDGSSTRPFHRIQPVRVAVHGPNGPSTGLGSFTMIAESDVDPDGTLHLTATV